MTTDDERFRALKNVGDWLTSIVRGENTFPKGKLEGKRVAYRLLKHYPDNYFIDELERRPQREAGYCPDCQRMVWLKDGKCPHCGREIKK